MRLLAVIPDLSNFAHSCGVAPLTECLGHGEQVYKVKRERKMANPFFKFKRFTVYHDRCAMKVGTDGVLLGAWTDVAGARSILDVGTGTGLIALMLSQRSEAEILAIDIDADAVVQARENADRSPWAGRIAVQQCDVRDFAPACGRTFDLIVSNPPYFTEKVMCPEARRNAARHTEGLDFPELIGAVSALLAAQGRFSVILPSAATAAFTEEAARQGLFLSRQVWVHTKPGATPKRVLLTFVREKDTQVEVQHLTLEVERHVYASEFQELVKDYYLYL